MPNTTTSAAHKLTETPSRSFVQQNNFARAVNMGTSQPSVRHSLNVSNFSETNPSSSRKREIEIPRRLR